MLCTGSLYLAYVAMRRKQTGPLAQIRKPRSLPTVLATRRYRTLVCAASPVR